jgi:hypothetical protein
MQKIFFSILKVNRHLYIMSRTLSAEGYCIGHKLLLYEILRKCMIADAAKKHNMPINPQRLLGSYDSPINLPVGDLLDALHIDREADRMHFIGLMLPKSD